MPKEPDDEDEDEDMEFLAPDPQVIEAQRQRYNAFIRKDLIENRGFEEDELDVLFPDHESLVKFYEESGIRKIDEAYLDEGEKGKAPGDDKTLEVSKTDKAHAKYRLESLKAKKKKVKKMMAKFTEEMTEAIHSEDKSAFEEAGAHLPPDERVSYQDLMDSLAEIEKLEEEGEDE